MKLHLICEKYRTINTQNDINFLIKRFIIALVYLITGLQKANKKTRLF
jgi:hypothetical protein